MAKKSLLITAVETATVEALQGMIKEIILQKITAEQKMMVEQAVLDTLEILGLQPPSDKLVKTKVEPEPGIEPGVEITDEILKSL